MHKLTRIIILSALSIMSAQSIFANYPNPAYGQGQNYQPGPISQNPYNSPYNSSPDMSGERSFMMQSQNRYNQMFQQNRNMIEQDQRMRRQGFDPNEMYYRDNPNRYPTQYDRNNPYSNQEQMMRGNVRYQGAYNPGYNMGMPQSYPLTINYNYYNVPHPFLQQGYPAPNYYSQGYNMPKGYNPQPQWAANYGYDVGYNDPGNQNMAKPERYPLNENYPNAPRNDNQQRQVSGSESDQEKKFTAYGSQPYSSSDDIGDNAVDSSKSPNLNQETTNPNRDGDTTDEKRLEQSSSTTSSSSTTTRNVQR